LERQMRSTARAVSGARDAEVIKRRIERLLGEQSRDADLVETSDRLDRLIAGSYEQSLRYAVEHLESDVYDSFTRRLERFADLPPWLPPARASAEVALKPLLGHQWSRLRARSRKALSTEPGTVRDERLHVARKAAKRARYLAEAVTPVLGRRAEKMGKVAAHAQRVLGHYQDGVITFALLADAGEQAFRQGENSFVLGRMQAREAAAMAELYADFAHVAEAIERKNHRRWLR
jgi:CHAD domain-containing protein